MANLRTEYAIDIVKRGTGAAEAVQDLQSVQAAAVATNTATAAIVPSSAATGKQFTADASKMRQAASAMSGELRLLALGAFPQFAQQATIAGLALNSTAASAKILGVSAVGAGAGIVGFAAAIWTGVEALNTYKARLEESRTAQQQLDQDMALAKTLMKHLNDALDSGRISAEKYEEIRQKIRASLFQGNEGKLKEEQAGLHAVALEMEKYNAIVYGGLELKRKLTLETLSGYNKEIGQIKWTREETEELIKAEEKRTGQKREDLRLLADRIAKQQSNRAIEQKNLDLDRLSFDAVKDSLSDQDRQVRELGLHYDQLVLKIFDLGESGAISYEQVLLLQDQLGESLHRATEKIKAQQLATSEWGRVATSAAQSFASGFSSAVTGAFREGGEAFKKFGAQFLEQIGQMIIQAVILRAIFSALGGGAWASAITGIKSAQGGIYPRQMASGGIAGVALASAPVYFPRFNVQAGEAGPEWLTVLRSPRMMQVGGVRAAVGYAGNEELALSRATDLQRGGPGAGRLKIDINLDPGLRAQITGDAAQVAEIRINNNLRQDTETSRAVKGLIT